MKLEEYRIIFLTLGLIGSLLLASPILVNIISSPTGEQFSELYLLGPNHMQENYPYRVEVSKTYSVYLGVRNWLDATTYYVVYLKIGNQTDPLPDSPLNTQSLLPILYEYQFSITPDNNWESSLTFSIDKAIISANDATINRVSLNNQIFTVEKQTNLDENGDANFNLMFELWIFNVTTNSFQFNNRYANLNLLLLN